jgi:hypothetical protein
MRTKKIAYSHAVLYSLDMKRFVTLTSMSLITAIAIILAGFFGIKMYQLQKLRNKDQVRYSLLQEGVQRSRKEIVKVFASGVSASDTPEGWKQVDHPEYGISFKITSNKKYAYTDQGGYQFSGIEIGFSGSGQIIMPEPRYEYHAETDPITILYPNSNLNTYAMLGAKLDDSEVLVSDPENNDLWIQVELPPWSEKQYMHIRSSFEDGGYRSEDLIRFMHTIKIIPSKNVTKKTYTNKDLGFAFDYPGLQVNSFTNATKDINIEKYFSASAFDGMVKIYASGKDYVCNCDAGLSGLNSKFFSIGNYKDYSVTHHYNPSGALYAKYNSFLAEEDDDMGEGVHDDEYLYIFKINNSQFPVVNVLMKKSHAFIGDQIVKSFRLL